MIKNFKHKGLKRLHEHGDGSKVRADQLERIRDVLSHLENTKDMPMKNPPHPGHSIKDACLEPLELSITEGAKVLGVTRHTLSRVVNGRSGISPDMAIRLEKAGWSNADHWMRLQMAYELAQARRRQDQIRVKRYEPQTV
jgi:addiction module HigA family antidote